ncbi:hypothetical protein S40288_02618 [Stachybotrys chartarum IBT 40288]|nr:hypothetical protein S40288_02618 [Stachybotrys chartarum IBT 40288]
MATIKQIDDRTVHQIQSGQVIVDLCSVVKELVENSVDAGATNIDVRFKNQGLDLIEVQDNGSGIAPANYASVALKHHTSKLSSYSDIASLQTFGFRGEALASLCALSTFSLVTCLAEEAPKGTRLSFGQSGKLKGTSVVAAQRGTTVSIENLFFNLPVRRRELERNIKREWHKVIALLNQYACIQTNLKFSVSQQPTKGKRIVLFSTKGNSTTRDNIINIFGAKTMASLVSLNLKLEMQPSSLGTALQGPPKVHTPSPEVRIVGHVSRPVGGEGRQTPDRQMFFVNGRPCGLPQFARTFNEVYRSYNSSQSPFIFADIQLDTHMYDVNVSPDKRSILLHDQNRLLDTLRSSLSALFDEHDQTIPFSRPVESLGSRRSESTAAVEKGKQKQKSKPVTTSMTDAPDSDQSTGDEDEQEDSDDEPSSSEEAPPTKRRITTARSLLEHGPDQRLISQWVRRAPSQALDLVDHAPSGVAEETMSLPSLHKSSGLSGRGSLSRRPRPIKEMEDEESVSGDEIGQEAEDNPGPTLRAQLSPFNRLEPGDRSIPAVQPIKPSQGRLDVRLVSSRSPKRPLENITTVTIGSGPSESPDGPSKKLRSGDKAVDKSFGQHLSRLFSANKSPNQKAPARRSDISDTDEDEDSLDQQGSVALETSEDKVSDVSDSEVAPTLVDKVPLASKTQVAALGVKKDVRPMKQVEEIDDSDGELMVEPRAPSFQPASRRKDAVFRSMQQLHVDEAQLQCQMQRWHSHVADSSTSTSDLNKVEDLDASDAESRLALIISRSDFSRMRVAGQFNLGFIIAIRPARGDDESQGITSHDELFIVDQHASDEKYNFERLQTTMVVQSQRLVHPKRLQLTALEEEIVIEHADAIEANGFKVEVDMSGDWPVGSRCQLMALPLSRETTFDLTDFEELLSLLGEMEGQSNHIPRPSRVRKMFAMRACRSSIMIGKPLNASQMYSLLRHMGEMDKPWNCPHGRPTMRHLCRLQTWDDKGWKQDSVSDSTSVWSSYGGNA